MNVRILLPTRRDEAQPCVTIRSQPGATLKLALWISAVVAGLLLGVAGCDLPGKPNPADKPVMPDQIADFETLYSANCAGCHGAAGKLGPAPPLNDPLFAAIVPDEELLRVIQHGRAGTPMPAFSGASGGSLTDAQVKLLAEGVKSHWSSPAPPRISAHVPSSRA